MKKQYEIYPRKYSVIISATNISQVWDKIVKWRNNLKIKVEFLQNLDPTVNLYQVEHPNLGNNYFLLMLDNVSSIYIRETFSDVLIDLQNGGIIIIKGASITWPSINKIENFNFKHFEDVKIILSMNDWDRNCVSLDENPLFEFSEISIKPHLKSLNILSDDGARFYDSEKLRANLLDSWNNEEEPMYPQEVLPESEYTVTEVNITKHPPIKELKYYHHHHYW